MDIDGSSVRRLIGDPIVAPPEPIVAPPESDVHRIAFVSNFEGQDAIYYADVSAIDDAIELLEWNRLTDSDRSEGSPSWSPDGSWIAFQRRTVSGSHRQIFVKNVDSGEELQLLCGTDNGWSPSWSPDSTQVAFSQSSEGENDLVAIDTNSGNRKSLKNRSGVSDRDSKWSPDANYIAFVRGSWPSREIRVLHVNSEKKDVDLVLSDDGDFAAPDWAFDGQQMAYSFERRDSSYRHIYKANWYVINGAEEDHELVIEEAEQLTIGPYDDDEPSWSPDGNFGSLIAFTRENRGSRDIYVVNSSGGKPVPLLENVEFDYWAPSWSPNINVGLEPTYDCSDD